MLNTNYKFGEVHVLTDQIETGSDKVHFKPIFSNENGGVMLVANYPYNFSDSSSKLSTEIK